MNQLDSVNVADENNVAERLDVDTESSANFASKIKKQNQLLAKFERQLAFLKMKERKRDTRKKIELGGLVIKAKMDGYPKSVILGALIDALEQIENNAGAESLFQSKGEAAFMGYLETNKQK